LEMASHPEDPPAVRPHRFEHRVAEKEASIEHRDAGFLLRDETTIEMEKQEAPPRRRAATRRRLAGQDGRRLRTPGWPARRRRTADDRSARTGGPTSPRRGCRACRARPARGPPLRSDRRDAGAPPSAA